MHLHTPEDAPDPSAQRAADRRRLLRALNISLGFVLLLTVIHVLPLGDLRAFTVMPHNTTAWAGLLTAPLLHGSFGHLAANSAALLLLGTLAGTVYPKASLRALPLIWLGSGVGAWTLGDAGSHHLGASGITHGLMFLVFVLGLLRRDRPSVAAAMIAFFLYGGMLLTVLPQEPGVSWQSHLGGAIGGVLGAWLFRRTDPLPPRKRYSWELEDDAQVPADDELELPKPDAVPVLWHRPSEERGTVLRFPQRNTPADHDDPEQTDSEPTDPEPTDSEPADSEPR